MKSFDVVPIDQIAKRFADAKRMDTREAREGNSARGSRKAAREGAIRRARPRTWHDAEEEITAEVHFLGGLVAHPPVVVEIDTPIAAVREHLLERRISAVVVVDGGLVSAVDIARHYAILSGFLAAP